MQTKSLTLNEAFTLVRSRKPDVSPNFDFMQQLNSFEQEIKFQIENGFKTQQPSSDQHKDDLQKHEHEYVNVKNSLLDRIGANSVKKGVSPDSGIEFDRWASSDISDK